MGRRAIKGAAGVEHVSLPRALLSRVLKCPRLGEAVMMCGIARHLAENAETPFMTIFGPSRIPLPISAPIAARAQHGNAADAVLARPIAAP